MSDDLTNHQLYKRDDVTRYWVYRSTLYETEFPGVTERVVLASAYDAMRQRGTP